jgi:hypothetical protein
MRVDNILSSRFECVDNYAIAASQIFLHLNSEMNSTVILV